MTTCLYYDVYVDMQFGCTGSRPVKNKSYLLKTPAFWDFLAIVAKYGLVPPFRALSPPLSLTSSFALSLSHCFTLSLTLSLSPSLVPIHHSV
jgi:hypothetical protein